MKHWNIRLLLVESHAVMREGLKRILADMPDIREIGTVTDAASAMERLAAESWDLLLVDLALPDRSGPNLIQTVRARHPGLPILTVDRHDGDDDARRALRAGASGYVSGGAGSDELLRAVRRVAHGGHYPAPHEGKRAAEALLVPLPHEELSDREYQVLCLIGSGESPTRIAGELGVSVKTVDTYRTRVLEKLGMHGSAELMHYSISFRLVG